MSVYGEWLAATISAGESKSGAIDLGKDYDYLSIQIPHANNVAKLSLEVAERVGGNYRPLGPPADTDEENFGRADVWRLGGYRFIKVVSTTGQTEDWLIRVRGMRY